MSDHDSDREALEPLDAGLATLFQAERRHTGTPAGAKARVLERLEASIGGPPNGDPGGGSSAGGSSGGGTGPAVASPIAKALPLLGAFLVGGAIGAATLSAVRKPEIVYVERTVSTVAPSAPSPPETAVGLAPTIVGSVAPAASAAATVSAAPSASNEGRDATLAREREILDTARTALGRGDGAHAVAAVDQHAREFPRGQMAEEREAIGVQALAKLGRTDEAAARGQRFRKQYPNSVLSPVIDAALGMSAPRAPSTKE